MNILFMGTPDFAVHILDEIVKAEYDVVGVVSVPDKPAGRGQKVHESAVTKYAKKHGLKLLQPEKLKSESFINELKTLDIDVSVVVAFRMLPKIVWQLPKIGTFNLHASLLPQYRGAAPINWAIMNGETESGVTTFMIDEKIDTGNILLKEKVDINPNETAGELHDKLMMLGGEVVLKTLNGLEKGDILPIPQNDNQVLKDAPKIFKEDCEISWNESLEDIHNFIRGLSPYPAAWTTISNDGNTKTMKIFKANIQFQQHFTQPKRVIQEGKKLGIAHTEGYIWLEEVQLQGKKRMKALDFLNGFNITEDTHVA